MLEGIFHEVEDNLGPVKVVADDGKRGHGGGDFGVLLRDDEIEFFEDVVDAVLEIEFGELERGAFACFELGDHEHFLDDAIDADDVAVHGVEHFARHGLVV